MIYSASMVWAVHEYNWPPDYFYKKQLKNLAVSIPVFLLAAFFPYQNYKRKKFMMFSIAIMFVLLVLVHFIGFSAGGAQSWIQVPGFGSIQPSEFAKLVIIIYFASVFAKKYEAGTLDSINKSILPTSKLSSFGDWFDHVGDGYRYITHHYHGCNLSHCSEWHKSEDIHKVKWDFIAWYDSHSNRPLFCKGHTSSQTVGKAGFYPS